MDPIKPNDLKRWLDYVNISEQEFDRIADYFRDPRVWKWDESSGWCRIASKASWYKQNKEHLILWNI